MRFKAAVLTELDRPLVVDDVETTGPSVGQVLVELRASGICGAQLLEIGGHKGNAKFLPHLLGHEGFGIVREVGAGITKVKVGDSVVVHWRKGSGVESAPPTYRFRGKSITSGRCTTFGEYSVVSENRVTRVDGRTDPFLGALLGCALTTALGAVDKEACVRIGDRALVVGCGGVGLALLLACRLVSAGDAVGCDLADSKRALALSLGATRFLNAAEFEKDTGGRFDFIFDTVGSPELFRKAFAQLADSGKYFLVGQPKPGVDYGLPDMSRMFGGEGKVIRATQGGGTDPDTDIPRYARFFSGSASSLDPRKLVTHVFSLDRINEAIGVLRAGDAGRIMIALGGEASAAPSGTRVG